MNWNIVEGNWKQFKGLIKGQWGRVTDDPVDTISGKGEELEGKIQETFGDTQELAEEHVKQFEKHGKE